jgi:alpha-galactosidase
MSAKITLIGAGSAIFSLNLIKDLCLTPRLGDSTVCLMDVNAARLDAAFTLCRRYAEEMGRKLSIEKTLYRQEALRGADFVINTALAGSHEHLREGWKVAQRHGYRFGGSLHVMHDEAFWINFYQLRLMESIVKDVLEICPGAWLVMVANPVLAGVTFLKRKYPSLKLVGMCHGYGGVFSLAARLGLEREHVTFEAPGVNHFVWLTQFRYKGRDAYPLIREWKEKEARSFWETCGPSAHEGRKAFDLFDRFGLFPIGDTATPGGGAWGWWYHVDAETEKSWGECPEWWYNDWYFPMLTENVKKIAAAAADTKVPVKTALPGAASDEPMIPLIEALACDVERVVIVNIPNDGDYLPGVPTDFEVEVPALVSARGVQGIHTTGLPKNIMAHILRDRIAPVETELLAYEHGERGLLENLLRMDPWTRSDAQVRGLVNDILALPYHAEMREHYR